VIAGYYQVARCRQKKAALQVQGGEDLCQGFVTQLGFCLGFGRWSLRIWILLVLRSGLLLGFQGFWIVASELDDLVFSGFGYRLLLIQR
jgi:hypothetical protein